LAAPSEWGASWYAPPPALGAPQAKNLGIEVSFVRLSHIKGTYTYPQFFSTLEIAKE
jgi:hypothetical protein